VAGSTRDPGRQALFREKHGELPVYSDYREMLTREALDIVSIATPAICHAKMTLAALEAGVKGVFCEKAMAASLAECDAMLDACEKAGAVLAINHQRRWDDRFRALKRVVVEGAIGEPKNIQISFGGGRLCRGGGHMFDLALMLCDDDVLRGAGWLSDPGAFDPGGIGIFETKKGARLVVDGSVGMEHAFQANIVGEKGLVRILDGGIEFELWTKDESSEFGQMARRHLPMNYTIGNPMLHAVGDLVRCMEEGGRPQSSGFEGRQAFEMISAIHLSSRQGRAFVEFPLEDRELVIPSN
jgi:predicted dehydrogenase